jgi:hypothetical protein
LASAGVQQSVLIAFNNHAIEKEMEVGAHASVDLKTQLEVQPNHPGRRTVTSLMAELKPKKRKRSAVGGGATSPEEAQKLPQ